MNRLEQQVELVNIVLKSAQKVKAECFYAGTVQVFQYPAEPGEPWDAQWDIKSRAQLTKEASE